MSERNHGRRYSFTEKKEILNYLETHTYKDTCDKYGISETTLSRWRKAIRSGSKKNRSKIIISLPKFWLEYLNEQIETDVWENYSDAFLSILRDYFRSQTSNRKEDLKYLDNVKEIIPKLLELNLNIDAMLLSRENEVIYKSERWGSTEGIQNLIENWKKIYDEWINNPPWWKTESKRSGKVREFEFQNKKYNIRDMSVKHLIGVKKKEALPPTGEDQEKTKFLLGLKRKLTENYVYIFAKVKDIEGSPLWLVMDTLKRTAMGVIPTSIVVKVPERIQPRNDMTPSKDIIERWSKHWRVKQTDYRQNIELQQNKIFQIKTNPLLMQLATQVNKSLKPEEKEVLEALEKQLGKTIERITADPEQITSKRDLWKIPWVSPDMEFHYRKFPCHYLALNGMIVLLTLFNLGLSELPSEISNLKNLTYLNLSSNNLTQLPSSISNLGSLETLFLNNNQFTKVPDSIIELPRLHNLYIHNNKISEIPVSLTDAWNARFEDPSYRGSIYIPGNLIFSGNPIEHNSLSKEQELIVKGTGIFDHSSNSTIRPLINLVID